MNDEGFVVSLLFTLFVSIWGYQEFGGEQVSSDTVKWADQACAPNGGLDYIRHELFERPDYVCKTGAEGIIEEYIKSQKGR